VWLCADGPDKKPSAQQAAVGTLNHSRSARSVTFSFLQMLIYHAPYIRESLGSLMLHHGLITSFCIFLCHFTENNVGTPRRKIN
jgi:hypothetical protein